MKIVGIGSPARFSRVDYRFVQFFQQEVLKPVVSHHLVSRLRFPDCQACGDQGRADR